jgi:plastocyanin
MKFSSALQLVLAPLAVAKSARSSRHIRRDPNVGVGGIPAPVAGVGVGGVGGVVGGVGGVGIGGIGVGAIGGLGAISGVNAVIVWVSQGGGIPAQTLNQQVTVTQTITVPAGAAPTAIAGIDGASTTIQPGASGVVAGTGATHSVTVGGPQGLSFSPQEVSANVGDMIIFTFYGQNHTVTQSGFDTPCDLLPGGMDSGFMANPDNTIDPPPQVAMQVMTTDALWMFCAQGNHCGRGMTFSINPTPERTHAQFQANAIAQRGGDLPGTAITGGTGPAPADAAPAAPAPAPVDPAAPIDPAAPVGAIPSVASVGSNIPAPSAPAAVGNSASVGGGIVMGQGTIGTDGSCQCAVQCAGGAFPDPATQGLNAFGGVAGTIDMNAAGVVGGAAAAPAPVTPARR